MKNITKIVYNSHIFYINELDEMLVNLRLTLSERDYEWHLIHRSNVIVDEKTNQVVKSRYSRSHIDKKFTEEMLTP